jgi:hypothetical protein
MFPFHSVLPEIAQREVRWIQLGAPRGESLDSSLSTGGDQWLQPNDKTATI